MTRGKVLLGAIEFLKRGWTQNALARKADGSACKPLSKKAVCWCAEGAIIAASRGDVYIRHEAFVALFDAVGLGPYDDVNKWNDEQRDERPVIAAMRKALKVRR